MKEINAALKAQELLKQGRSREAAELLEQHGLNFHQFFEILREIQDRRSLRKLQKILKEGELLMDDVQKPLNATDKVLLRQIKDYSITILCTVNKLL